MSAAVTRRRAAARALLAVLALSAALPGAWAAAAPHSFYDSFPGARHWVRLLPPYNGHLAVRLLPLPTPLAQDGMVAVHEVDEQ